MAIIKTYPLKTNYYGPDRLVISDMQPDSEGNVSGDTKNLTLANLKSFIGGGGSSFTLTTTGSSGPATLDVNTNILNIPDYSTGNVDGSGTTGRIPKWQDSNTLNDSEIFQSGTNIGIGTTGPGAKLQVNATSGTTQAIIGYGTQNLYIGVNGTNVDLKSSGNSAGTFSFSTGNTERIRITSTGNVGIGTTNPTADGLEIANQSGVSGGNTQLFITGSTTGRSVLGLGDGSNRFVQHILTDHTQNMMSFHTGATAVTNNERMRITSTGNVGIGTTAPNYKLDVNGNFRAKGITSSTTHTVTIEATTGWYRIMQWGGASRGGATVKLSTTGGNVTPTTYVINAYKTYGNPAASNTLKLEQYGNFGAITKARIATDSVTNVTYVEIYNAYTSNNYTMEVYHDSLLGLDSLTSVLTGTLETGPNSVSQDELPFVYEGTTTEKSSSELVTLIGDGTNDGKLRLNCSANSHYVEIVGPTHSGGSSYSLKLPNTLPNVSNQILESNGLGILSWIPTPSGGGGSGGTVTSVGLTMPPAFSVGNSPITGNGNISVGVTGGTNGEFLAYNGTWGVPASPNPSATPATNLVALSINGTVYGVPQGTGNGTITAVSGQSGISGAGTSGPVVLTNSDRGSSQLFYRTFTPDNGSNVVASANQDTMLIKGGAGITTSGAGDQITIANNQATNIERGGVKLFTSTVQSVNATGVSSTAGRTYGIQLNSNGQAVVNVPWTSGSGGGISFSGSTADGLATYSNSTTAKVNSEVRLTSTGFMTFDGSNEGAGVNYFSTQASAILRFGDMTGDSAATVELWTDGNRQFEIGVNGEIGLGTGASQGTSGQVLTSQGNGSPAIWSSNSGQNIANTNLTQTANRTYAMGQYSLTFTGNSSISMQQSNGLSVNGNINSGGQINSTKHSLGNKNTSFTINWNDSNVQQVNLTNASGNVIIGFSNIRAGARYTVITTRLGFEGSFGTYSFNSVLWPNDITPVNVPTGSGLYNMYEFVATTTSASGMLGYAFRNYQTSN